MAGIAEDANAAADVATFRHAALRRVACFIGADGGSLMPMPHPPVRDHPQVAAQLDVDPRLYARFVDNRIRYWRALHRVVAALVTDGAVVDTEVYSRRERERLEPYADTVIPAGITSILCAPVGFQGCATMLLCLNRHARAAKFGRRHAARLRAVVPLIGLVDAAVAARSAARSAQTCLRVLSPRERQVGALIHGGLQNKEIAVLLGTSAETVRKQTRAIYHKLEVEGRVQLVARFGAALAAG